MQGSRFIKSMGWGGCIWGFILRYWGRPWPWRLILVFMSLCGDSVTSMSRRRSFRLIRKCWFLFLAVGWLGLGPGCSLIPLTTLRRSFNRRILMHGSTRTQLIVWRLSTRRRESGLFSRDWGWLWSGRFQSTVVGLWRFSLWWGGSGGGGTRKQQSDKF